MPRRIIRPYIEFQGDKYFLENNGYYRTSRSRGRRLLHRDVWAAANGPIPDGWDAHHRNGRADNSPESLEACTRAEHVLKHAPRGIAARTPAETSDAMRASWAVRQPRDHVCTGCGDVFASTGQRAMFCSKQCRRQYYYLIRGY